MEVVWFDTLITGCIFKRFSVISLIVNWPLETLMKLQCQICSAKIFIFFLQDNEMRPRSQEHISRKERHTQCGLLTEFQLVKSAIVRL
jgi:hypothetical protein